MVRWARAQLEAAGIATFSGEATKSTERVPLGGIGGVVAQLFPLELLGERLDALHAHFGDVQTALRTL